MGQFSALDCEPGDWESVRLWFQVLGHILRLISMQCIIYHSWDVSSATAVGRGKNRGLRTQSLHTNASLGYFVVDRVPHIPNNRK